jgi:hypothetical protein
MRVRQGNLSALWVSVWAEGRDKRVVYPTGLPSAAEGKRLTPVARSGLWNVTKLFVPARKRGMPPVRRQC